MRGLTVQSIREFSNTELVQKIKETNDSLFKFRLQHASKQLTNSMKIRQAKRERARLLTILKEKAVNKPKTDRKKE